MVFSQESSACALHEEIGRIESNLKSSLLLWQQSWRFFHRLQSVGCKQCWSHQSRSVLRQTHRRPNSSAPIFVFDLQRQSGCVLRMCALKFLFLFFVSVFFSLFPRASLKEAALATVSHRNQSTFQCKWEGNCKTC